MIQHFFDLKFSNTAGSRYAGIYNRDKTCQCPDQCQEKWIFYSSDSKKFEYDDSVNVTCRKYWKWMNLKNNENV